MRKHILQNRSRMFVSAAFLLALPAYSVTITSSISPTTLLEPDQSIIYSGPSQTVTPGTPAAPDVIADFGAFQSSPTPTGGPTLTFTFDINPQGSAAVAFMGTFLPTSDSITITGTGIDTVNNLTYATIAVGDITYGVQNSVVVNPNKTVFINGLVFQTPEPSTGFTWGLGFAIIIAAIAWRRLIQRRPISE